MKYLSLLLALLFPASAIAADSVVFGATNVELKVVCRDSSTGAYITSLTNASSGLNILVSADKAADTNYSGSNIEDISNIDSYAAPSASKIRFKAHHTTNDPGTYLLWPLDAWFSTANARTLEFRVTVTGAVCDPLVVPLLAATPPVDCTKISGSTNSADNLETASTGGSYNLGGGGVVAASVTTKTGYELSSTGIEAILNDSLTNNTTAGTAGKALSDAAAGGGGGSSGGTRY